MYKRQGIGFTVAGIIFFFAYNWDELPKFAKLGMVEVPTVLSSTFGFGIAIAAAVLFCWQGSIYLLAGLIEPFITDALMTEISLVGGILILSSGLGILGIKQIRTLNLLPALLVPPVVIGFLTVTGFWM